ETDAIVNPVEMTATNHWHPGGLHAIGQYLLVPLESAKAPPNHAAVLAYDLGNLPRPSLKWVFRLQSDWAAAVGVAKLSDDTYLMVTAGHNTRVLEFYKSRTTELTTEAWTHLATVDATRFAGWAHGHLPGYQAMHLVTDERGGIFLVGTWKDDTGPLSIPAY